MATPMLALIPAIAPRLPTRKANGDVGGELLGNRFVRYANTVARGGGGEPEGTGAGCRSGQQSKRHDGQDHFLAGCRRSGGSAKRFRVGREWYRGSSSA